MPLKIALDIGGVMSKYPDTFWRLWSALQAGNLYSRSLGGPDIVEVHVISDMHDHTRMVEMVQRNSFPIRPTHIHAADYLTHGERCKAVLCEQLGIDILIDDHMGYVSIPGQPLVRLFVMPDADHDYYHPTWWTDGSEGNFGRRSKATKTEDE